MSDMHVRKNLTDDAKPAKTEPNEATKSAKVRTIVMAGIFVLLLALVAYKYYTPNELPTEPEPDVQPTPQPPIPPKPDPNNPTMPSQPNRPREIISG